MIAKYFAVKTHQIKALPKRILSLVGYAIENRIASNYVRKHLKHSTTSDLIRAFVKKGNNPDELIFAMEEAKANHAFFTR